MDVQLYMLKTKMSRILPSNFMFHLFGTGISFICDLKAHCGNMTIYTDGLWILMMESLSGDGFHITGIWEGSMVTGGFPSERASNQRLWNYIGTSAFADVCYLIADVEANFFV